VSLVTSRCGDRARSTAGAGIAACGAIIAGAALRVVWAWAIHPPEEYVTSDMQGYVDRAIKLALGQELVQGDAFYPPGTHMLLAPVLSLAGTDATGLKAGAIVWASLSALTPLFAWRLGRLLLNPAAAALTAVLTALYPLFIFYSGYFLSETPSLTFLLGALWLGYATTGAEGRAAVIRAAGCGAFGAAAVANRPQFVLNILIVAVPILVSSRVRWRPALALVASGAVILAGALAHNWIATGGPTGISENGGLNFFQSHCDVHLVRAGSPEREGVYGCGSPVPFQLNQGSDFNFPEQDVWDQGFFYDMGWIAFAATDWATSRACSAT